MQPPVPSLWRVVFGDDRPVEVEIGPGRGDVLLAFAARQPDRGFFGIERSTGVADAIVARAAALGLHNVRAVGGDARCIVERLVPAASVAAYHIYFPDPWWKRRHFRRRLFTPAFVAALARTLIPGGRLFTATDVDEVFELPLDFLLDPANAREMQVEFRGHRRTVVEFVHASYRVWGATAAMLVNLRQRLERLP